MSDAPSSHAAYLEACRYAGDLANAEFSNEAVNLAAMRVGWQRIRLDADMTLEDEFTRAYNFVLEQSSKPRQKPTKPKDPHGLSKRSPGWSGGDPAVVQSIRDKLGLKSHRGTK